MLCLASVLYKRFYVPIQELRGSLHKFCVQSFQGDSTEEKKFHSKLQKFEFVLAVGTDFFVFVNNLSNLCNKMIKNSA